MLPDPAHRRGPVGGGGQVAVFRFLLCSAACGVLHVTRTAAFSATPQRALLDGTREPSGEQAAHL